MGGLKSSAYEQVSTPATVPIALDSKILEDDIVITSDMLGGNSGLLRLWWSFTTGTDYVITITKNGDEDLTSLPLKVNGDNDFALKPDGYYRFDIGVRPGDLINLSCNVEITKINELQIQQIQIGA